MNNSTIIEKNRKLYLFSDITMESSESIIRNINILEDADCKKDIVIYINSAGGDVQALIAIHDIIKASRCRIATVGCGKVFSSAALLLMSGTKGLRYITPNTRVMLHQLNMAFEGNVSEWRIEQNECIDTQMMMEKIIRQCTKIKEKHLSEIMDKDTYFSAEDSIKYSIADHILDKDEDTIHKLKLI